MKKSLIVGCSITHGSELISDVYDPRNVEHTYANGLSKYLGYEPNNIAIPGNSNEGIFHDAVKHLSGHNLLIVGWTSLNRESWTNGHEWYFFNTNWGCMTNDLGLNDIFVKQYGNLTLVSSEESKFDDLRLHHKMIAMHKFGSDQLLEKLMHYRQSLKALCQVSGISYIDLSLIEKINDICCHRVSGPNHPNKEEHQKIMNSIVNYYNL